MNLDYDGRVQAMIETWGEQENLPKTYFYGDFCNIKIYKENDKIRFEFNCENGDIEEFMKINPDFVENALKQAEEKLKQERPELFYTQDETSDSQENTDAQNVLDYMAMYNKLDVKKTEN